MTPEQILDACRNLGIILTLGTEPGTIQPTFAPGVDPAILTPDRVAKLRAAKPGLLALLQSSADDAMVDTMCQEGKKKDNLAPVLAADTPLASRMTDHAPPPPPPASYEVRTGTGGASLFGEIVVRTKKVAAPVANAAPASGGEAVITLSSTNKHKQLPPPAPLRRIGGVSVRG